MASRNDVIAAYKLILGREPDNDEVIRHHMKINASIYDLRRTMFHSQELVAAPTLIDHFYMSAKPARYSSNSARYVERGGVGEPDDASGYLGNGGAGDLARYYFLSMVRDLIQKQNIQGDFAELGVYRGATASVLAQAARRLKRQLYLLDTFEGFSKADITGVDSQVDVQFSDTSEEKVRTVVGEKNVHIVKGYFPGTAALLPDTNYALVHIDCDLYAPIRAALNYFWPRLSAGGFMIVHDYMSLFWDGAEQAVDEFFADKAEAVIPIPDASGTVAARKSRRGG